MEMLAGVFVSGRPYRTANAQFVTMAASDANVRMLAPAQVNARGPRTGVVSGRMPKVMMLTTDTQALVTKTFSKVLYVSALRKTCQHVRDCLVVVVER